MAFKLSLTLFTLLTTLFFSSFTHSSEKQETINIAVASNFLTTANKLKQQFEIQHPNTKLNIISGSTGQLSHQILNGAPFDVFLAANKQHPAQLQKQLNLEPKQLFHYATGKLVLVSHLKGGSISELIQNSKRLAVANHKLAPYGLASREVLQNLGLIIDVKSKTITGQNIAQAYQFFTTKNVDSAFIAKSQLIDGGYDSSVMAIDIKPSLHSPIEQWGLLVRETAIAASFIQFLKTEPAQRLINSQGYKSHTSN